jgi:hypothetical protein
MDKVIKAEQSSERFGVGRERGRERKLIFAIVKEAVADDE